MVRSAARRAARPRRTRCPGPRSSRVAVRSAKCTSPAKASVIVAAGGLVVGSGGGRAAGAVGAGAATVARAAGRMPPRGRRDETAGHHEDRATAPAADPRCPVRPAGPARRARRRMHRRTLPPRTGDARADPGGRRMAGWGGGDLRRRGGGGAAEGRRHRRRGPDRRHRPPAAAAAVGVRRRVPRAPGAGRLPGAPRFLGVDDRGRDVLDFVPGDVPGAPPEAWACTDEVVAGIGRLVRDLHDASAGWEPPPELPWFGRDRRVPEMPPELAALPGPPELVAHCDVTPQNVVFRDGRPVALVDFDLARPTRRVADLLTTAMWWVPLHGPGRPGPGPAGRRRAGAVRRVARRVRAAGPGAGGAARPRRRDVAAQLAAHAAQRLHARRRLGQDVGRGRRRGDRPPRAWIARSARRCQRASARKHPRP